MHFKDKQIVDKKAQIRRYDRRIRNLEKQIHERGRFVLQKRFKNAIIIKGEYFEDSRRITYKKEFMELNDFIRSVLPKMDKTVIIIIEWHWRDNYSNQLVHIPNHFTIYEIENNKLKKVESFYL